MFLIEKIRRASFNTAATYAINIQMAALSRIDRTPYFEMAISCEHICRFTKLSKHAKYIPLNLN